MAVKLGTLLVREGVITPAQLEEALRIQVVYGSRLGTNLVELGYVELDAMSDWLGRVTGFPVVTQWMCEEASDEVLRLIPAEMAERFECFPLHKDGRRLHLGMVSPADLAATDALSFKTGLRIVPYSIAEVRLYQFLETRYGVVRKQRYIRLSATATNSSIPKLQPSGTPAPSPPRSPATPPALTPSPPQRPAVRASAPPVLGLQPPARPNPFALPAPAASRANPRVTAPVAPVPPPAGHGWDTVTRPEVRPVSQAPARAMPPAASPPVLRPAARPDAWTEPEVPRISAPPTRPSRIPAAVTPVVAVPVVAGPVSLPPLTLPEAIVALDAAQGRDDIAEIVLRFGLGVLDGVMLFLVRDGMALGWKGRGQKIDSDVVELIMLPLNAPSMFQAASETRLPFQGAVADLILHKHFYRALRRDVPPSVVVVPVVMRDRAVNLVYGDRLDGSDAGAAVDALTELCSHVSVSYERILRDSKRRQEGR